MNGAEEPFGSQVCTNLRASQAWQSSGTEALDYGAILLPAEFRTSDGRTPGTMTAAVLADGELGNLPVSISGYPGDKPTGTQWQDAGPIMTVQPERLRYTIDTFGGHSGSAVVRSQGTQMQSVGIHNYGGCPNKCTRITAAVKADLDAWLTESNGR